MWSSIIAMVGGVVVGIAYAATFPLAARQVQREPQGEKDSVVQHRTKQAYRMATLSLLRFSLAAGVLVGLGRLTATPQTNDVVQTGWAIVGLVVGLGFSLLWMGWRARRLSSK